MPQEVARIADQLRRATNGHAWCGPSAREALDGVTAEMAAQHPIPDAHSMWELVRHLTVWANAAQRRLSGEIVEPTPDEDYPALTGAEVAVDWRRDREAFFAAQEALAHAIEILGDAALDTELSTDYTIYVTVHGQAQHILYHAGQIVLLKRALTARAT
jgi:DinB superfamily